MRSLIEQQPTTPKTYESFPLYQYGTSQSSFGSYPFSTASLYQLVTPSIAR